MSDFDFDKTNSRKSIPVSKQKTSTPAIEVETPQVEKVEVDETTPEYSQEELLQVFDEILFSNEYTEDFNIRNRLKITFRTRTAQEIQDIDKTLDTMGAALISTVEGVRAFMNLESALVTYQGKDLSSLKKEDKSKFIGKLPGPIIGALMITLSKFDRKIALACQVGEANF